MRPFALLSLIGTLALLTFVLLQRRHFDSHLLSPTLGKTPYRPSHQGQHPCDFASSAFDFKDDLYEKNFSRAVLRPQFVRHRTPSLIRVDGPFLTNYGLVSSALHTHGLESQSECDSIPIVPIDVTIDPPRHNTEGILLGMTTTLERLRDHLHEISYYLLRSKVSLLVLIPEGDEGVDLAVEERRYRRKGLEITLVASDVEPFQLRYFSLIRALGLHIATSMPQTKWVGTVDDDSFYPRILEFGARLSHLDPSEHHWIGTISESSLNVKNFGYFSYGGSGIFHSRALLERMNSSYDECTGTDLGNPSLGGDHRTTKCLGKLEPTLNVTVWKELRQWDLRGHTAGLFESGKQIWTFHHWGKTGWFNQDVLPMVATAPIAGEASVLQRIRFGDSGGSIATKRSYYVLTNGFSIVKYDVEAGVKDVDFDETEYTWNDNPDDYEDYLGPFRKVNVEGVTKKRWRLDGAKRIGDNIHQMYKYDRDGEIDFIEIIWLSGH